MRGTQPWPGLVVSLTLALALAACPARAQTPDDDDVDDVPYRAGLVADYSTPDGSHCRRLDESLQFVWRDKSPDPRLRAGPFQVEWNGLLLTTTPGKYQLSVHAAGGVEIELAGRSVLDEQSDEAAWHDAQALDLDYGYHPLRIRYTSRAGQAELRLYWTGPQFQLEPITHRQFFNAPDDTPDDRFFQGRLLAHGLRCAACHELPDLGIVPKAPALDQVAGQVSRDWLVKWLTFSEEAGGAGVPRDDDSEQEQRPTNDGEQAPITRRMPAFGLTHDEAEDLAAFLLAGERSAPEPDAVDPKTDPAKGRQLFHTLGCLACHRVGQVGAGGLFGGPDLSDVGLKRDAAFFARWLEDPAKINRHHRMPVFKLEAQERNDVAAWLVTLEGSPGRGHDGEAATSPNENEVRRPDAERGRRLFQEYRCASCHALGEGDSPHVAKRIPAPRAGEPRASCLDDPHAAAHRPGFALDMEGRAAIESYLRARPSEPAPTVEGELVLAERNCLACHPRGPGMGIADRLPALQTENPELSSVLALLSPPSLSGVGDKLRDEALAAALELKNAPLRPWLLIRMPQFHLSEPEAAALRGLFVDQDRIPARKAADPQGEPVDDSVLALAGRRLVTADGFGCTSCHQIGGSQPVNVPPGAHGSDLTLVGSRVRRTWFDRWCRNPARIVPRMEMPSIQLPVRGVLDGRLHDQLEAVWHVLNLPGFTPPQPNPVRVVRAKNLPAAHEPAVALLDVLELGPRVVLHPVLAVLPNRHNVLFDLATNRLTGWWMGDGASQRTRGKSWYWEASGVSALVPSDQHEELLLREGRQVWSALAAGTFAAELDWLEHTPDGLRFGYRATFRSPEANRAPITLRVVQTLTPIFSRASKNSAASKRGESGFRRRIEVFGVQAGFDVLLRAVERSAGRIAVSEKTVHLDEHHRLSLNPKSALGFESDQGVPTVVLAQPPGKESLMCELEYLSDLPSDEFSVDPMPSAAGQVAELPIVPGFEALRLAVPPTEMITGLAWRPDGTLVATSLKGSVLLGRDTDGDELEDQWLPFADELAAPYGVETSGDAIDVINKFGLLRLYDQDGDGRAERTEVVASGWGYSADYHDWAIGLPRTADGHYFVGLPCQQDDRSAAQAVLRGTCVELVPREPTADDPRRYRVEPFCGGLRFPMGLALNAAGDLFATDNQGNYNPFNELNHLVRGARYGFINKLEARPGFRPEFRAPAINIPHPWTRSVNGICFLETPRALRERGVERRFGPWEGHLLGCEFDTRRLVRMSLERVGDSYQGAIYPCSLLEPEGSEGLEGPVMCRVAPDGDVYVGNLRDSGWGGGQNTGSLVRLRPSGPLPLGIAEVRAVEAGFTIDFTDSLPADWANRPVDFAVQSYRRISTSEYGGPDVDQRVEAVHGIEFSDDRRRVRLQLQPLRAGYVYEIRILKPESAVETLFPSEAYFSTHE